MKQKLRLRGPELQIDDIIISCEIPGMITPSPWNQRVVKGPGLMIGQVLLHVMHDSYRDGEHIFTVEREVETENEFGEVCP